MIQSEKLKEHARRLRLYNIANRMDSILHHAQEEKPTYPEFLSLVLGTEVEMSLSLRQFTISSIVIRYAL